MQRRTCKVYEKTAIYKCLKTCDETCNVCENIMTSRYIGIAFIQLKSAAILENGGGKQIWLSLFFNTKNREGPI